MFKYLIGAGIAGILSACVAEKLGKQKAAKYCSVAGPIGVASLVVGIIGQICRR